MLGEDLPPGRYQLKVQAADWPYGPSFVSLYQIRPNEPSARELRVDRWSKPVFPNSAKL
jgi:hypothetical protein